MAEMDQKIPKKAQTVLGLIEGDDLGVTLTHEHLLIDMAVWFSEVEGAGFRKLAYEPVTIKNLSWLRHNVFSNLDNLRLLDEELAIEEVMHFKKDGGNTIVEVTNIGLNRDPIGLAHISRVTGVNIIMGSGYYVGAAQCGDYDRKTEDEIAEEIISDIEGGVGDTGIRAGIIGEIGCSWPLQDREKKCLRAAAYAQQHTGAAINVHPGRNENSPMEIIKFLNDAGADLSRVIVSHMDRIIHSLSTRCELAETGCYLEYDLFGSHIFNPIDQGFGGLPRPCDRERIEQIIELIAKGYLKKILVSQDTCMKIKLIHYGGNGYAHILSNIVPQMIARGISRKQIDTILMENPKRMLEFTQANT